MSMEAYRSLLRETSSRRSISIDASGNFSVRPRPQPDTYALEVDVDEALLGATSDCRRFEATTPQIPVPLPVQVVAPLIDPTRWGEFSDIKTSNADKKVEKPSGGWSGTIEERFQFKFLGLVIDYHNLLKIDFDVVASGATVDFALDKSYSGGLDYEKGYFRVDEIIPGAVSVLSSKKALSYAPPSGWCRLPVWMLEKILLVWLTAATAEYALKVVEASAGSPPATSVDLALAQLQQSRRLFDSAIAMPAP